ncbi:MAG TPA: DUF3857 domain-containing protein [Bacteroidales bacterium]|nr:DUF3857 domain-containing protein [Bacteroidales bacterium]
MKNLAIYFLMLFTSVHAYAGFRSKEPVKWGKINPAEFSIQPAGSDANAPAIVLCDYGNIEISNRTFYNRHTRIKILNNEGLRYASVEIPYQSKNKHDVFYELKAQTLVLENGKVLTYKVEPSQIEDVKINDQWSKKKFTFPMVKPGVVIEYTYNLASLDFEKLDTWYFQRDIPVIWSEIRFNVPPPFTYLVSFENNRNLDAGEEGIYGEKLQWLYNTKARPRHFQMVQDNYLLFNTSENRYKVWALNDVRKKIIMKNLPGLNTSAGKQPVNYYYPQVRFDLFESSGNLPRAFRPLLLTTHDDYEYRGDMNALMNTSEYVGYVHYRMKTWSQFNDNLLKSENFGDYLIKSLGKANTLPASANELERVDAVYRFVKENFAWNGQYSDRAAQPFKNFMETRKGSSAELNLVLVNLFRQYGIQSDPVLIRTSDLGLPEKMFPVKNQFNHVIASAQIGGKTYLFDVTSNSGELNHLNKMDLGTSGWIVRKDNPGWIETFNAEGGKKIDEEIPIFEL